MRILLLANNWGGLQITRYLQQRQENIVGLVLHPEDNRKFATDIEDVLRLPPERVWSWPQLQTSEGLAQMRELEPDIIITAFWAYLLKPALIRVAAKGCVNVHPALLPRNRGWHANAWPIIDGSPAGVTVHYIDEGADTGDIIAQREVPVAPVDTGGSLHKKLTRELVDVFREAWPAIREGTNARIPQDESIATSHRRAQMDALDCIDLERTYKARDLLGVLRARTYPPYPAAYFMDGDERIYVRVQLLREHELDAEGPTTW